MDERIVARQIGRRPRGMLRVERRCAWGYPEVIAVHPLPGPPGKREPFPTLFRLTCPVLVEQVSRLEATGLIGRLEEEIAADPAMAAAVAADHAACAAERFALLSPDERREAGERGMLEVLRDSGVGGSRDRSHLKCLHMHVAHHLARGNAVGALLAERHPLRECPEGDVRCDAFRAEV